MNRVALYGVVFVVIYGAVKYGAVKQQSLEHVHIKIDKEVTIAPPTVEASAANMVIHPDGTIWLNSTTGNPGLFRSSDKGETWTSVPVNLPDAPPNQYIAGFYITRDGRFWIAHQVPPKQVSGVEIRDPHTFVSSSADRGKTWRTTRIEYGTFAPGAPKEPYTSMDVAYCHPNFVERPDGALMFSASMRYTDWADYEQADQSRPGIRDVMIRTTDGGKTWGDPTIVHQHATETAYAVNPNNPDHILAATRIQRKALPGEDAVAILRKTAVPYAPDSYTYKNGLLLESTDGGRTFREVPNGLLGFGSYRWTALWNKRNVLVLVSVSGQQTGEPTFTPSHVARISLDGGEHWVDGTAAGTTALNKAKKFVLIPVRPGGDYSNCVAATVEIAPNHFLTVFNYKREKILKGRFWHLEKG